MNKRLLASFIGVLLIVPVALAQPYRDVPSDSPYREAIYDLQKDGVMTGNDDGSFGYGKVMNRAELLTLAYRAADKEVRPIYYDGSFKDVPQGQWFTDVIYTAKHDGVIQGYSDGTARPGDPVNLVEAAKIFINALEIPIPFVTQEDRLALGLFRLFTTGAWYLPWMNVALIFDMVPEDMKKNNSLDPGGFMKREQAAHFLLQAMNADLTKLDGREINDDPSDDNTKASNETGSEQEEQTETGNDVTPTGATIVSFPLHRTGITGARGAAAYAFTLDEAGTVLVEATNLTSATTGIDIILYLLGDSGFSHEFYTGYKDGGTSYIRASLSPGQYQVEVRSRSEGAEYSLDVTPTEGDGNDGFNEAISLAVGAPRSGSLIANDYADWYRVRVSAQKTHRIKMTTSHDLSCSIYPGESVDLFGFQGPLCGESYDYPPGTYYVEVKKTESAATSQAYTIELR